MTLFHRVALAFGALALLSMAPAAQAGPLRFTFYDCGASVACAADTSTVMAQFVLDGALAAPAVPPAGSFSPAAAVPVTQVLAGAWSGLEIQTFNTNNVIGSMFLFHDLLGANGKDYGGLITVAAASLAGLQLNWSEGVYTNLGWAACYTANCSTQTTIRGFEKLVVDAFTPTATVPEPAMPALVAAALALGGLASRRRGGARPAAR